MPTTGFFHGSETNIDNSAGSTLRVQAPSMIGLMGIAPLSGGGSPTKTVVTPETKATAVKALTKGSTGDNFYIYVIKHNAAGQYLSQTYLGLYTQVSGDTTNTLFAASIASAIAGFTSEISACTASTGTITATVKAGYGASANYFKLYIGGTAATFQADFTGGVDAAVTVVANDTPQTLDLCNTEADDAKYGALVPGFNLPYTLKIIREIVGNCPVLVVNIFDASIHTSTVTDEVKKIVGGTFNLAFAPIGDLTTIKKNDNTALFLIKDVDYTIDAFGKFTVLSYVKVAEGDTLKITYKKLDAAAVTAAHFEGEIEANTNIRTGSKLFDLAMTTYGFKAKLFAAPGYASTPAIINVLATLADKFKGDYFVDAPSGTSITGAITGRGVNGTFGFNRQDERATLLHNRIKRYDAATNADVAYPASAFMLGVAVKNDQDNGFWTSWSNKPIPNATGVEMPVSWDINDPYCDANLLNAQGITAVVTGYGQGFKTWGNRNSSFPVSGLKTTFTNVRRTLDVLADTLVQGDTEDLDKSITQSFIDYKLQKGNALINDMIADGALYPGTVMKYFKADNSDAQLADGHITFRVVYDVPAPAERIEYKLKLDITLSQSLN